MTEREREVIRGEVDVSANYLHQVRTRVRSKIERLVEDAHILEAHQPDLYRDLQDTLADLV